MGGGGGPPPPRGAFRYTRLLATVRTAVPPHCHGVSPTGPRPRVPPAADGVRRGPRRVLPAGCRLACGTVPGDWAADPRGQAWGTEFRLFFVLTKESFHSYPPPPRRGRESAFLSLCFNARTNEPGFPMLPPTCDLGRRFISRFEVPSCKRAPSS